MTSVEKRRSRRKSGSHRKHSDGGYSDTSSAGSFLDETDREVSNLTDRAFRSLCIGDEAVYNDSDLGASSPCTQRDRQLALSHSGQDRDREREELKRAAHESFSLRMQQYGQDWTHGGMYGAEIQRDPQWEGYGERAQGRVSATFQHSFMETSQQEESLRGEQLSCLSNGATEVSSQQRRSRSRVSSLIKAFNSEGNRDGAVMDGKLREWNDDTSWDKSALMSIQRELSEFSTSYQENFNSVHFPSAGPLPPQNTNFYSSEVAAMTHMNSGSAFMRSSHSKHSMTAQVNCNSNFFIHSEFSPFKVWRDHNRFPFQQGEVSGFMHYPDFPRWYETPMYKELSLEPQPQGPYRYGEERGFRHPRNNLAPVVPPTLPRSTSTSTMLQKASALEKRCDSELAGHYHYRKRTQSLGANRLPNQRPSTASPTIEMSRRVQDTISSVRALQQKIKMMTEQNISTDLAIHQQEVPYSNENNIPFGNYPTTEAPSVVNSNTSTTPFNISQLLTPAGHAQPETETLDVRKHTVSPQPVEHPPVRAESRGATPDVRMSNYKSRATSLLFNLKDNRKRVKSTYSPTKFKGLETQERNKQPSVQEPRDTVIDIPDFPDTEVEEYGWTNAAQQQYADQYHSHGSSFATTHYDPVSAYTGQHLEYTSNDYQTAQMQGEMVHHSGFTHGNYTSNQLANGQAFIPYEQGMMDNVETLGGDGYGHKPSFTATETPRSNVVNQTRELPNNTANTEQHFYEYPKVDRYQQLKDNHYDYNNVSWKQEQKYQNQQDYQKLPGDKYSLENPQIIPKEPEGSQLGKGLGVGASYTMDNFVNSNILHKLPKISALNSNAEENSAYSGQQKPETLQETHGHLKKNGHNKENEIKDDYMSQTFNKYANQGYKNQHTALPDKDKTTLTQETIQREQLTSTLNGYVSESLQPEESKPQFEQNTQKNYNPYNVSDPTMENQGKDKKLDEVTAEQDMAVPVKVQHAQEELAMAQLWAKEQQPKVESSKLNLAEQTGAEKVRGEQVREELSENERVNQAVAEEVEKMGRKDDLIEQTTEKQPELERKVEAKAEKTIVQKVTEAQNQITEEAGAQHMKEEQDEQVKVTQAEAERFKNEHIKTEQAETERAKVQQSKSEKVKRETVKAEQPEEEKLRAEQAEREQTETERAKAEQAEAERRKAELKQKEEQVKAEHVKAKVGERDLIQSSHVNNANLIAQISKTKVEGAEEKAEDQVEQTKVTMSKLEATKIERVQEESVKPTPKPTLPKQVKSEPDKVEQVKTELAKAKAELAKIKEKMRGEQKHKVKNTVLTKEDEVTKVGPESVTTDKNEEYKDQDQEVKTHPQSKDMEGTWRQSVNCSGMDEYYRLREKYGFTDTPTIINTLPATGNVSLNDADETPDVTLNKLETKIEEKPKDKHSLGNKFATADTEKKEVSSFNSNEGTESQYVYSESSKEFKLSNSNNVPKNVENIPKNDSAKDTVKVDKVEKMETCDPPIPPQIPQPRDSILMTVPPLERKPKLSEHNVGLNKDLHSNPPKTLSHHRERAQTKQEILTSKIKAHAEKEISAIKEKGFALRDGLMYKTSTKQFVGGQSMNIRQRPPSQEVPKKHDGTTSSNTTPKHQMEPQGTQMAPVRSVPPSNSTAAPVMSAATTSQSDLFQKVPKEPTSETVVKPPTDAKQTGTHPMRQDDRLVDNENEDNESPMQSKVQALQNQQGKQESSHGDSNSGNEIAGPKNDLAIDAVNPIQGKEALPVVEVKSSQQTTKEKAENKEEAVLEDSAPSLSLVIGQNRTSVADSSLQIRGIMVTVRERKPSLSDDQMANTDQDQISAKDEKSISEPNRGYSSSGPESSKEENITKEVKNAEPKDGAGQSTHPTMINDKTKESITVRYENLQGTSNPDTRSNDLPENVKGKRTGELLHTDMRPQREIQPQEPLAEKSSPSTVTVSAKNNTLAETQPLLHTTTDKTQMENSTNGIQTNEVKSNTQEKNPQKRQTPHPNESNIVTKQISHINDSNRNGAEKLDIQPAVKDDTKTVINSAKSSDTDGNSAPQQEDKKLHLAQPKPPNKTSPSLSFTENDNTHVENTQVDDNLHIDSIAIRVVPADFENIAEVEKQNVTAVPTDVVASNEHKEAASTVVERGLKTLEDKDHNAEGSQTQLKTSSEENSVMESVRKLSDSLKNGNEQESIDRTSQNTRAENGVNTRSSTVDESKSQPTEEDYFQVQGLTESHQNLQGKVSVGGISDSVPERRELPGLLSNKGVLNKESNIEGKNEVFLSDQSKTEAPRSSSLQEENIRRNLASKQSDGPTERHTTKNEKSDANQAIHIRKQHTENRPRLSSRERQSPRNSDPTRENAITEKPEVKPKPKPRTSTIPEISALADYARLKVIVSEDRENTVQEFPPNKKEGFFPLIQTRHSRRPVFTDPQDFTVKERALPNKTEVSSKVNKEPKPLVFPITEKEHQRTGMFKLGDKERQEKQFSDAKANEGVSDAQVKHSQHIQERQKSPKTHLKKEGNEEVPPIYNQRRHQEDQSNNPPSQTPTSFSAHSRPGNNSMSQHIKPLSSQEKHEEFLQTAESTPYLDKNSHPKPTLRQVNNTQESTRIRKDEKIENALAEKVSVDKQLEDTKVKQQSRANQLEGEHPSRIDDQKREENMKRQHIIEESRASLAEEERRAAKREEERRTRERDAIANKIKERREKQREAERRAEEERKRKEVEGKIAQQEVVRQVKELEETRHLKAEEQQRKMDEERRLKKLQEIEGLARQEIHHRRAVQEEQKKRAALEEQQKKAAKEKLEKEAAEKEQLKRALHEKEMRAALEEERRKAALEEQRKRAVQEEKDRRAAQQDQERRAALEEQRKRAVQEEQQRRAAQEQRRRAVQEEKDRRAAQEDQERRAALEEQKRRAVQEEQQRRAAQEDQERRAALEEQQRIAAQEQRRRAALEEQQRRKAQEEQEKKAALEEQQKRAAREEQERRAAHREQQRRAAQEEQDRRAAQEEQDRRAAQEEQQRKAAQEEQQRKAAQEEQQRKAAQEKQQRRAAQEEQQRRAAHEEELRKAVQEKQQKRAAQEEQQRRAAQEKQQRRAAQEEEQKRAAQEEQQRRAALEKQHRRAAQEEQQRRAAFEEQQKRADLEVQQTKVAKEEQDRRAHQEEEQWRAALIEEQLQAKLLEEKILSDIEGRNRRKMRDQERASQISKEERVVKDLDQKKAEQYNNEEHRGERKKKEGTVRVLEESQAALKEEKRDAQEQMLIQNEGRERDKAAQRVDALQYYAITSTDSERNPKERELYSSQTPQPRNNQQYVQDSTEDSESPARSHRPHAPASPAPPRSNTSSPALGVKPSMFRVKDNTFRGSSFTKSVKPRFHKNFGEDYRVGSPIERGPEEEQEKMRRSAGTPVHPDMGSNRLASIREFSSFQPSSSSQDNSAPVPQHRPYSRRSIALDEDDCRSVISTTSEGVESFATSAADLSEIRSLYCDERPESACSFSSDVSRSLGKPPVVPPKSEKALRRAKRLTSRRINKELSKAGADSPAGVEKPHKDVSSTPSSSTEVRPSNSRALASPHFTSPVSLAHAPTLGSSLPSSHTESQSSYSSFHASPHATGPVSLQVASPHAAAPVSLPVVPTHATGPASHTAAPKTVAHVPSSPTLQRANHPAPVTQYQVESTYPQSYPLTQRKVLQDIGSGQYFVVDVPVPVKTKTFIDPETGKYVQLNVRESAQNTPRPQRKLQHQQAYIQPQLQPQMQAKPQQQPLSPTSPVGKPVVLYDGYHGYPQGYQPAANKSVPHHRSSTPGTSHQDQQQVRESSSYGYPAPESRQNSEGPRYSPEKTPYMDTVNDSSKTYNTVYNTHSPHESLPECDTNSQLAGSSVRENDNSAHSRYQPREIITISELEDFMEVSDW
ncbi:uncharacterized protein LOC121511115 [Xyrichtys novacula]|uniref:Uncharacterized protein LOC121511115 n=1 Tax=Xyrichtys novacula TaxID=13765 RepID=A0AAV1G326_XYRNO|nr:uncharacterized protein LOC121511115 [Xyrichtys novacula]